MRLGDFHTPRCRPCPPQSVKLLQAGSGLLECGVGPHIGGQNNNQHLLELTWKRSLKRC